MSRPAPPRSPATPLASVVLLLATLATLAVVLTATGGGAAAATRAAPLADTRADPTSTPLAVSIVTLAPGTIPQRGRVTVTGRITNRSQDTWTDLNVYLLTSPEPLRSRAQLATAAASDSDAPVGGRVTGSGLYDRVGDLAPGATAGYRLSVRRADLGISGRPGVYWVGVHVLGSDPDGRDTVADGRARTFMPLVPRPGTQAAARARTRLALLMPVRKPVQRGSQGRLVDPAGWDSVLAPRGRLTRLLGLSGRARGALTWVLDPALLEAVSSVARGNPALDVVAGSDDTAGPSARPPTSPRAARAWLAEFRRQAPTHAVTALPYGDLDVAAALAGTQRSVYDQGVALSRSTLARYGVRDALPVVDPPDGYLPGAALDRVGTRTPVVLRASALPRTTSPALRQDDGAPVLLTDENAGDGGPEPESRLTALSVRQRLLSEAALHALSADRTQPLVVQLPTHWDPGAAWGRSRFFRGLDTPWLQLVDLPAVLSGATRAPGGSITDPTYPARDQAAQVPDANLAATRDLSATGRVLARLLTPEESVDVALSRMAMLASSYAARRDPDLALRQSRDIDGYVRGRLAQVRVEGPPFVMMSGESGPIQVTLINGLARSVTVGLRISTPGSDLRVTGVDPVTLAPGRRTSVRLAARSDDIGVHAVTLETTNSAGMPLGSSTRFNVRTSHVSTVIWVLMAAGGALLLVAVVVRLIRRVRVRKATHGPLLPQERDA